MIYSLESEKVSNISIVHFYLKKWRSNERELFFLILSEIESRNKNKNLFLKYS